MPKLFHLSIVSPKEIIYSAKVVSLVAPAQLGYMGILADHAPLVAKLVKGRITVRDETGQPRVFDITGPGFMEVRENNVSIIL